MRPLRIAQVTPPLERVPPRGYGGTERVVDELIHQLGRRGHKVTLFASGDSEVPCELVPTVPQALRPAGFGGDAAPYFLLTMQEVLRRADEFDVIHSHLEWYSFLLGRATATPVVSTFHGRLDFPFFRRLFEDPHGALVAVSQSQRRPHPTVPFTVVHNGLSLESAPFERRRSDDLCFVGRVAPEKGILDAIEVARLTGRKLRIAAKIGPVPEERAYYDDMFVPAMKRADVEFLGEVSQEDRDRLLATSYAFLMPGRWPEPFGLVAIEALACGTPILARRVGALPEIIRPGVDGFFADDVEHMAFLLDQVAGLDRVAIRESVIERFSGKRMTDGYEAVYESVLDDRTTSERRLAASAFPGDDDRPEGEATIEAGRIAVGPMRIDGPQPKRVARPGSRLTPLTAARSSGGFRVSSAPLVRPPGPRPPRAGEGRAGTPDRWLETGGSEACDARDGRDDRAPQVAAEGLQAGPPTEEPGPDQDPPRSDKRAGPKD